MFVHRVEPGQHPAEIVRPYRQHQRQANGRVLGIAPADPIPELKHISRIYAELADLLGVSRNRHEMPGHRFVVPPGSSSSSRGRCVALVMVSMVVKVLEEIINRVSAGSRSRMASTKSVPSTFETKSGRSCRGHVVTFQRFVGHDPGRGHEPPMPMLMMFFIGLPVAPRQSPLRT